MKETWTKGETITKNTREQIGYPLIRKLCMIVYTQKLRKGLLKAVRRGKLKGTREKGANTPWWGERWR